MELQRAVVARGYSFLTDQDLITKEDLEKPIYFTIAEHIELRNEEGDFEDLAVGKDFSINLSVKEAEHLIKQLQKGLAEFESVDINNLELA